MDTDLEKELTNFDGVVNPLGYLVKEMKEDIERLQQCNGILKCNNLKMNVTASVYDRNKGVLDYSMLVTGTGLQDDIKRQILEEMVTLRIRIAKAARQIVKHASISSK